MKITLIVATILLTIIFLNVKNVFAVSDNLPQGETSRVSEYLGQVENLIKLNTRGVDTSLPVVKDLINTNNLSKDDIFKLLKTVGLFAVNIFLVIIQTVADVLRALLSFIK